MTHEELESVVAVIVQRLDDWTKHCGERHEFLDKITLERNSRFERMLMEVHAAVYGNGKEGMSERVLRHTQSIKVLERDVIVLTNDMDMKFKELNATLGALNLRFWKMAVMITAIVVAANKVLDTSVIKSILGI